MTPKPLTPEEREKLIEIADNADVDNLAMFADIVKRGLAAEAYWREAVKNAPETDGNDGDGLFVPSCMFCGVGGYENLNHSPDCPWLLAQDPSVIRRSS